MKGNFRISRDIQTNVIHLYVIDELSEVTFLILRTSPEDLAKALTGNYTNECEFELRGAEVIGKRLEMKHEVVTIPGDGAYTEELIQQVVAPLEVDGWMARTYTIGNHHYQEGRRSYKISLIRFVDAGEDSDD